MEDKKIWGIHTLNDHMMLDKNLIAIGWTEMGNLSGIPAEREAFKQKYREIYPDAKVQSVANSAGMLYRFVHEAAVGDYVVHDHFGRGKVLEVTGSLVTVAFPLPYGVKKLLKNHKSLAKV